MAARVGIFIDGPNLYGDARRLTGEGRLDIPALVSWIAAGREIAEASFWTGQLDQSVNPAAYAGQRRLFARIERDVPNARIGRATLKQRGRGWVEKGVDVGVAMDLVLGAADDRWDAGVVVSGDGDLARSGGFVRAVGKRFEVVCCRGSLSDLLRREADLVTQLGQADLEPFSYVPGHRP